MILSLRTDNPQAEVGLYSASGQQLAHESWPAHRELSSSIHRKIEQVLGSRAPKDLSGIIFYEGPGSFTGLRIGAAVANTMANQLDIPVVQSGGNDWTAQGLSKISANSGNRMIVPEYGRMARVTKPRK